MIRNFSLKEMTMNYLEPLYLLNNGTWRKHSSRSTHILPLVSSLVFIMLTFKKNTLFNCFKENNPGLYSASKRLSVIE